MLLYNFFEDSAIDASRWSVLLNDTEGEVDGKELTTVYAPSFGRDEGRFAGVCSEASIIRNVKLSHLILSTVEVALRWDYPCEEEPLDL